MKIIGLTGGIGSGKSTVAKMLEELGAVVIHADTIGHEAYRPMSEGWCRVTQAFGPGILAPDQTIDRRKLGALVFAEPEALKRLNAIVHPLIFAAIRERIEAYRAAGATPPVVVEAAILIEANWLPLVDEVWLVVAHPEAVIARLRAQRDLAPTAVQQRIAAQMSDVERRKYADVVLENTGSLDELRTQVSAAWTRVA